MVTVELRNVTKRFGEVAAANDVSLTIADGEFFTLLGPSGCGKTTTMRIVAGLEFPDSGSVIFDGVDVTQLPSHRRNTGMVFQNYALWPHMTVAENVAYGLEVRKVPKAETARRVKEALELVHLGGLGARFPTQLSGGQQQRVALARVLVINPSVLLLDEPLSNLDAKLRVEMREEIKSLQKRLGITTVYVTHDQEEAMTVSDRVAIQSRGEVRQVGSPADVYNWPRDVFVATFIGKGTMLEGTAHMEGGAFRVEAAGLTLHCANEYMQDGSRAVVVLRPEAFSTLPPDEPHNTISGSVEWSAFVGPYNEIKLNVGEASVLVQVPADTPAEVGTRLTLHIPCRRTILLPPEE